MNDGLRKSHCLQFQESEKASCGLMSAEAQAERAGVQSVLSVSPELGLPFLSGLHAQSARGCLGSGVIVEIHILILAPEPSGEVLAEHG